METINRLDHIYKMQLHKRFTTRRSGIFVVTFRNQPYWIVNLKFYWPFPVILITFTFWGRCGARRCVLVRTNERLCIHIHPLLLKKLAETTHVVFCITVIHSACLLETIPPPVLQAAIPPRCYISKIMSNFIFSPLRGGDNQVFNGLIITKNQTPSTWLIRRRPVINTD